GCHNLTTKPKKKRRCPGSGASKGGYYPKKTAVLAAAKWMRIPVKNSAMIRNNSSTLTTAHETVKPRSTRVGEDDRAVMQMLSIVMMLRLARW
ncbi:hypothetical protein, partial [Desulfovibrio sp.]|uniref:hypothetical protein n=1 Tax=Desulfovibrio sp. TaxID=885 RepID=UPI0035B24BE1